VDERESGDLYNCDCPRDANGRKVCAHLDRSMEARPRLDELNNTGEPVDWFPEEK
jgi:hypothetical protein